MTSIQRIKGANGVIIESNAFLELPKAPTTTTSDPTRSGMIRYNNSWKAFEGVIGFDDGSVGYRRFAQLDANGQLLSSQLPDSVTSGMAYIGTYSPITDDIDPPVVLGQFDKLPIPSATNAGDYFIVRGLQDAAQVHYKANTPTTSPVIFTPDNPSNSATWIEIKYYFGNDPVTPAQNIVVAAFGRIITSAIPSTGHEGLVSLSTDPALTIAFTTVDDRSLETALTDSDWIISNGTQQQRLRQNRVSISAGAVLFDRTLMTATNRSFLTSAGTAQTIIDNLIQDGLRRTGDSMYDDGRVGAGRLGLTYGTVTAPSIAFNNKPFDPVLNPGMSPALWSDTNTGIYHPAIVGAIGIVSSGVERFRITPNQIGIFQVGTGTATNPNIIFNGPGNVTLGMNAINNMIQFSSNNLVNVSIESGSTRFNGQTFTAGNINGSSNLSIDGTTILGASGSAITSLTVNSNSTFMKSIIFNDASNRFVLGATLSSGALLSFEGTSTATMIKNATELRFNMGAFHDLSIYDGTTLRTKFNRYGIQLPVLSPINNTLGVDGMIAYSTDRKAVIQKANGVWSTVGTGGGIPTSFIITDWVLNGSYYNYTVTNPNIQTASVQELTGSNYSPVEVDSVVISPTNVVISVPAVPDLRFNGRILVQYA